MNRSENFSFPSSDPLVVVPGVSVNATTVYTGAFDQALSCCFSAIHSATLSLPPKIHKRQGLMIQFNQNTVWNNVHVYRSKRFVCVLWNVRVFVWKFSCVCSSVLATVSSISVSVFCPFCLSARVSVSTYQDRDLTRRHDHQLHHHYPFHRLRVHHHGQGHDDVHHHYHHCSSNTANGSLSLSLFIRLEGNSTDRCLLTGTHLRVLNRHLLNSLPEFLTLLFLRFV